jgi:ABC-type branched-subunit amino acid transport system ATPase component
VSDTNGRRRRAPLRAGNDTQVLDRAIALDVQDVSVRYGALQVVFDVSFQVREGARVALLGTNGAGKSTLLRAVAGLVPASNGRVELFGQDVSGWRGSERARCGMTLVEGGRATFPSLTVQESLEMGVHAFKGEQAVVDERLEDVLGLFPQLKTRMRQAAGTLSGGEQQMVAIGRALMSAPRLLMIDELTLGLAPVVMGDILRVLEELASRGTTMVIIEQSVNMALHLADEVHFMEKGQIILSATTTELLANPDLVRTTMLGG